MAFREGSFKGSTMSSGSFKLPILLRNEMTLSDFRYHIHMTSTQGSRGTSFYYISFSGVRQENLLQQVSPVLHWPNLDLMPFLNQQVGTGPTASEMEFS